MCLPPDTTIFRAYVPSDNKQAREHWQAKLTLVRTRLDVGPFIVVNLSVISYSKNNLNGAVVTRYEHTFFASPYLWLSASSAMQLSAHSKQVPSHEIEFSDRNHQQNQYFLKPTQIRHCSINVLHQNHAHLSTPFLKCHMQVYQQQFTANTSSTRHQPSFNNQP